MILLSWNFTYLHLELYLWTLPDLVIFNNRFFNFTCVLDRITKVRLVKTWIFFSLTSNSLKLMLIQLIKINLQIPSDQLTLYFFNFIIHKIRIFLSFLILSTLLNFYLSTTIYRINSWQYRNTLSFTL